MKQLDFLLLGIDHLVNTYDIIRNMKQENASFTIMPIVVDNGYQGPQSSFNNLPDICSIARISGFSISTKWEAEKIISNELVSPGFRIITISQRLFKEELPSPEKLYYSNDDNTVFQYGSGNDVTIVCFNFSFPQGYDLYQELKKNNINASIFNVTSATPTNWDRIIEDVQNTKKIVIMDDSKSQNLSCDALVTDIHLKFDLKKKIILKRTLSDNWLDPVSDKMEIDTKSIINELSN
jgi:pyruvate/2-oxoglutarate/acetoin dehydrogenase E1 component